MSFHLTNLTNEYICYAIINMYLVSVTLIIILSGLNRALLLLTNAYHKDL